MKIFYHLADADGKCSGYLVNKLAKHTDNYDVEFCGINYGMEFPIDKIREDEQVFIVDYSIFPEEMDKLFETTRNIVWIDHHASSIKRYENYERKIPGARCDGVAGCVLTYCYLKHYTDGGCGEIRELNLDSLMLPEFVAYIGDYDVWLFEYGDATRYFHAGLMLEEHNPWDGIWEDLLEDTDGTYADYIKNNGIVARKTRASMMKDYCKTKGFETMLDGHKAFAVNMANISTDDFASVDSSLYDMFIGFSYDGNDWNYSLRSTKVNCSELAMKYGGGGHVEAAGFNYKDCLLKRIE